MIGNFYVYAKFTMDGTLSLRDVLMKSPIIVVSFQTIWWRVLDKSARFLSNR